MERMSFDRGTSSAAAASGAAAVSGDASFAVSAGDAPSAALPSRSFSELDAAVSSPLVSPLSSPSPPLRSPRRSPRNIRLIAVTAASFVRLLRSAPTNPGVLLASTP